MHCLEEEKESELIEAQEELRAAQEEVLLLQQAAEDAAAERENDIASLQEELCRRRAELQRLSEETQEYELEITTLRAEISMKSQRREAERKEGERRGVWVQRGSWSCSPFGVVGLRSSDSNSNKKLNNTRARTHVSTAVVGKKPKNIHKQKADFLSILCRREKEKRTLDVPSHCALTSC